MQDRGRRPGAPGQNLAQLKAALARAVIAADPDWRRRDTGRPDGIGGWWSPPSPCDGHVVGDAHR